jgi:hypothetical protein
VSVEEMRWKLQAYACEFLLRKPSYASEIIFHSTRRFRNQSTLLLEEKIEKSCVIFKEFTVYSNCPGHYCTISKVSAAEYPSFIRNNFMARGNQTSWDFDVIFRNFGTLSFYWEFTDHAFKNGYIK